MTGLRKMEEIYGELIEKLLEEILEGQKKLKKEKHE